MMGWLSLFAIAASGCLLIYRWPPLGRFEPLWLWRLLMLALGCAGGLGLGSCLFFLLLWSGLASRTSIVALDVGFLLAAALLWGKRRHESGAQPAASNRVSAQVWIFRAVSAAVLLLLLSGWRETTRASPHGDWDAFAIWNLRAKFLAGGDVHWRHAVSPALCKGHLGAAHPDYPLLLSGLVAQGWMLSGRADPAIPIAIGLFFGVALLALLAGALAALRDERVGWVGFILLAGSESFASQIAAQCADIPLACYVLSTSALLAVAEQKPARATLWWAGVFAALAAWTKNEGLVFFLLALAWCLWRGFRRFPFPFLAGAAPALAVVVSFKLFVAPLTVGLFPTTFAEAFGKLGDPQRAWLILQAYARALRDLGFWWAHPLVLALVWLWASGWVEPERRRQLLVAAMPLGMLAAGFLVYMLTVADLRWHLSTSVHRVWLQVWPSLLMSLLLAAHPDRPELAASRVRAPSRPRNRVRR
ncbi:MAG: hypothetical protein RMI94_14360 [Bryobacterales bacterium]|nr:DUF4175 domain-containing protein [Bryobacteraceae bacterium]MDW8131730.1 hypothetical protein [Bryobacterales bacterium]